MSASLQTRMAHWIARVVLRDSVGTLMRPGSLGVGELLRDGASARDPGPCRCQRSRPSSDVGTRLLTASQGSFARSAIWLVGSAGHRIVDLSQGGKVVSVLCAVWFPRWSRGATISAQQLPWCTPGRQLALRDVLLLFFCLVPDALHVWIVLRA